MRRAVKIYKQELARTPQEEQQIKWEKQVDKWNKSLEKMANDIHKYDVPSNELRAANNAAVFIRRAVQALES